MTNAPSSLPTTKRHALVRSALACSALLVLSACNHSGSMHTGSIDPRALNYDQRHALSLQQQEHSLPLLVGAGSTRLTEGDRTALRGFVRTYSAQGSGTLRVRVPTGSMNASAASHALADIHDVVSASGGNPAHVTVERYHVGNHQAHAPIIVVYDRLEAITNRCGDWSDRANPALQQNDYYNYGCATQANFGAMLQDPRDLIRPRGVGYPDAGRRAEVLARYRRGEPTASTPNDPDGAEVSDVD